MSCKLELLLCTTAAGFMCCQGLNSAMTHARQTLNYIFSSVYLVFETFLLIVQTGPKFRTPPHLSPLIPGICHHTWPHLEIWISLSGQLKLSFLWQILSVTSTHITTNLHWKYAVLFHACFPFCLWLSPPTHHPIPQLPQEHRLHLLKMLSCCFLTLITL